MKRRSLLMFVTVFAIGLAAAFAPRSPSARADTPTADTAKAQACAKGGEVVVLKNVRNGAEVRLSSGMHFTGFTYEYFVAGEAILANLRITTCPFKKGQTADHFLQTFPMKDFAAAGAPTHKQSQFRFTVVEQDLTKRVFHGASTP